MHEWVLTSLSLIGTWFNIQKKVTGWVIWLIANVGWVVSFSLKGMLAEATLFSAYTLFSIYGIIKWMRPAVGAVRCEAVSDLRMDKRI